MGSRSPVSAAQSAVLAARTLKIQASALPTAWPNATLGAMVAKTEDRKTSRSRRAPTADADLDDAFADVIGRLRAGATDTGSRSLLLAAESVHAIFEAVRRGDINSLEKPARWAHEYFQSNGSMSWFAAWPDGTTEAQVCLLEVTRKALQRHIKDRVDLADEYRAWRRNQKGKGTGSIGADSPALIKIGFDVVVFALTNARCTSLVGHVPEDAAERIADALSRPGLRFEGEELALESVCRRILAAIDVKSTALFKGKRVLAWLKAHRS